MQVVIPSQQVITTSVFYLEHVFNTSKLTRSLFVFIRFPKFSFDSQVFSYC